MKIYITGKVTGLDITEARTKFENSERKLIAAGVHPVQIINPMKLGIEADEEWHVAMQICLSYLRGCRALYIQRDWRDSFGARKEITEAMKAGMQLYYEECGDLPGIEMKLNETFQTA